MPATPGPPIAVPDRETSHVLADGWTIHVLGSVVDDEGWSGGHTTSTVGYLGLPGATIEETLAALDARRAEDQRAARTPVPLRVRLTRGETSVTVFDEARLPAEGPAMLLWPPTVVPDGVVLRWSRETTVFERVDGQPAGRGQAPRQDGSEPQPGVLVTLEGQVRELPFELNVAPIAVAPDGRLVLPSQDPLWWDDGDAPLTLLALDGEREPLLVGGQPVTPSRLLGAIGEPFRNSSDDAAPASSDPHWTIRQARFARGELALRLVHDEPEYDEAVAHDREWVAVALALEGRGSVRRLGTGTLLPGEPLPPL